MKKIPTESIDLIYLDPPFNSNRSYNLLYKNTTGLPVPEQIEAFCDAWDLDYEKSEMAKQIPIIMQDYGIDKDVVLCWRYMIEALKNANPKMLAYLVYMTIRLVEMHRILRPTGTIFLQ
jgi:DNA modification methylase